MGYFLAYETKEMYNPFDNILNPAYFQVLLSAVRIWQTKRSKYQKTTI